KLRTYSRGEMMSKSDIDIYYQQVREKIVHEDELVHQRTLWTITVNGFLFGAFGLTIGPQMAGSVGGEEIIANLRSTMGTIGIATAVVGLGGVIAAYR